MIVAERKNIKDIIENLKGFRKVLVVGCNACVGIYQIGGKKQAEELAALIKNKVKKIDTLTASVARQCNKQMVKDTIAPIIGECDAVLSAACGSGVQTIAEVFDKIPVLPANDTRFIGMQADNMLFEMCTACGNCILDKTGGICPITRCPKSILNGPCGGLYDGKCEVDKNRDCVWVLIYKKLNSLGRKDLIKAINSPKDFTKSVHPRKQEMPR